LHQFRQRSSESFGLTVGQLKQFSQHQQALNRPIAVDKGVSDLGTIVVVSPLLDDILAEPEGDRPSLDQRFVILSPVCDPVSTFPLSGHVEPP
jgi:hypothetical protein